jgi:hypothetical protein
MNATTAASRIADWIRPWYPAGLVAHTRPDCPDLLKVQPHPREGSGWLNPNNGKVCLPCLKADGYPLWDAHCNTCRLSLAEEKSWNDNASIFTTKDEAIAWKRAHQCEPCVSLISPQPVTLPQADDRLTLFPLADLIAVESAA